MVTLLRAGNLMRHISAVLIIVLMESSTQWNLAVGSSLSRFVRSEVGEVMRRWVALECTCFCRTLNMLMSGFHAQGQSFRLQKVFRNTMSLPVLLLSFSRETDLRCESPLTMIFWGF